MIRYTDKPVLAGQRGVLPRRWSRALLAAGIAAAVLVAAGDCADARSSRRFGDRHQAAKKDPPAPAIKGPLILAVSIASQRLTIYDGGVAIAQTPISTGMPGHSTPTGVFSVIQKDRFHRSNIYSGAPMPFMQRITWSGVALHAGVLPGYPASHGCIRLPHDFAARLWGMTKLGARVIVARHDVTPFDISHARLAALVPPADPAEKRADGLRPSLLTDGAAGPSPVRPAIRTAEAAADIASDASPTPASQAAVSDSPAAATETKPVANEEERAAGAQPAVQPAETASTASAPIPASAATTEEARAVDTAVEKPAEPAASVASDAAKDLPKDIQIAVPAAAPASAEPADTTAAIDLAVTRPAPAEAAKPEEATTMIAALSLGEVFMPPERPVRPLRAGPISVFISRKDAKLYVRKRFDPLFSVPLTLAKADEPIGTHVFTAVEADGAGGLRWIGVSLPPDAAKQERRAERREEPRQGRRNGRPVPAEPVTVKAPTAAEALDRLDLPVELNERIAALMSAGATLIVSDQGLGGETGLETDFIVLTR